jgi:hypothetical protein
VQRARRSAIYEELLALGDDVRGEISPATERTLETMRVDGGHWIESGRFDHTGEARIPPFEDVELEVGRLFAPVHEERRDRAPRRVAFARASRYAVAWQLRRRRSGTRGCARRW